MLEQLKVGFRVTFLKKIVKLVGFKPACVAVRSVLQCRLVFDSIFFWIRIKLEILKVESNQLTTQQFFSEV